MTPEERSIQLGKFHRLLNTDDGQALMADLKIAWGSGDVFDSDIAEMARKATFRQAYDELESYQSAEVLNQ